MLLQNKLEEQFGGAPEDCWSPVPKGESDMEGRPCLAYSVCNREGRSFAGRFLAAKILGGSDDKGAIWKQTLDGSWESFYQGI